jgi:hypothetical protein
MKNDKYERGGHGGYLADGGFYAATAETAYANVVGSKWFYCEQYQKEYL